MTNIIPFFGDGEKTPGNLPSNERELLPDHLGEIVAAIEHIQTVVYRHFGGAAVQVETEQADAA